MNNEIDLARAKRIITDNAKKFVTLISNACEGNNIINSSEHEFILPIFKDYNIDYDKYQRFERYEEHNVKCILIDDIIIELLLEFNDEVLIRTPSHIPINPLESIVSFENRVPLEFYIEKDGTRIGYRYSNILESTFAGYCDEDNNVSIEDTEEIGKILSDCCLSKITTIIFDEDNRTEEIDDDLQKYSKFLDSITIKDFFITYFSEEVFDLYVKTVKKAIIDAENIISFSVIPRLTPKYLCDLKHVIFNDVSDKNSENLIYYFYDKESLDEKKVNSILLSKDLEIIDNNFNELKLSNSFVGNSGFAKCFYTSEYLFNSFDESICIDYTAVVAGYIKALEQLLYVLMKSKLNQYNGNDLWIKANNNKPRYKDKANYYARDKENFRTNPKNSQKVWQVRFAPENEKYFDISLKPLFSFLCDDSDGWYIEKKDVEEIRKMIDDYTKHCRNEHFHKDNILTYSKVETIRNNTIVIMYLVLGGYKITGKVDEILEFGSNEYNCLYKLFRSNSRGYRYCILEFEDGTIVKGVRDYINKKSTVYDENGNVATPMVFVKVKEFTYRNDADIIDKAPQRDLLLISRNNIPKRITSVYKKLEDEVIWEK